MLQNSEKRKPYLRTQQDAQEEEPARERIKSQSNVTGSLELGVAALSILPQDHQKSNIASGSKSTNKIERVLTEANQRIHSRYLKTIKNENPGKARKNNLSQVH